MALTYTTLAAIKAEFASLVEQQYVTDSQDQPTPNDAIFTINGTRAQGSINGYLARRYSVPVVVGSYPETAELLEGVCTRWAVYNTLATRSTIPKGIQLLHDEDIEYLQGISDGKIDLPGVPIGEDPEANPEDAADWGVDDGDTIEEDGYRLLTRDGMGGL